MQTIRNEFINCGARNAREFAFVQNLRASTAGHLGIAYHDEAHDRLNEMDLAGVVDQARVAEGYWDNSDRITDELDLSTQEGRLIVRN